MAKRLIERMSSIIIDKECLEALIELIEYKVKQRLTFKQRKLLNKRKKKVETAKAKSTRGAKSKKSPNQRTRTQVITMKMKIMKTRTKTKMILTTKTRPWTHLIKLMTKI